MTASPGKRSAIIALGVAAGAGGELARRRLEAHLLERLRRRGHANPHAMLGLRWAATCFVIVMSLDVIEPYVDGRGRIWG